MKMALLFPGQGSQYVGMGKTVLEKSPQARETFEEANDFLGFDIKKVILNGPEESLRETKITQPAIFIVSAALFRIFRNRFTLTKENILFAAGHSLGEYSALFAADVFDFKTGLKLIKQRGEFLQECCQMHPGTMAAVMGMERNDLEGICKESSNGQGCCEMVNFNSPGQIVVAGTKPAVEILLKKVSGRPGTKTVPLNVSGAFHSSLMRAAAQKMSEALKTVQMNDARIPVVTNCDARATVQGSEIREKLVKQIDHPVLWEDSIQNMASNGADCFVEIGPGRVLSGLMRRIDRKMKALNIEDGASLEKALAELGGGK